MQLLCCPDFSNLTKMRDHRVLRVNRRPIVQKECRVLTWLEGRKKQLGLRGKAGGPLIGSAV